MTKDVDYVEDYKKDVVYISRKGLAYYALVTEMLHNWPVLMHACTLMSACGGVDLENREHIAIVHHFQFWHRTLSTT